MHPRRSQALGNLLFQTFTSLSSIPAHRHDLQVCSSLQTGVLSLQVSFPTNHILVFVLIKITCKVTNEAFQHSGVHLRDLRLGLTALLSTTSGCPKILGQGVGAHCGR